MVRSVTISFRENKNGQSSTPTCSDFARRNAGLPKAGSSATERSSAVTSPARSLSCRLPSLTSRPSARVSSAASVGRNWFTLMRNGALKTASMITPKKIPNHFRIRLMYVAVYLFGGDENHRELEFAGPAFDTALVLQG